VCLEHPDLFLSTIHLTPVLKRAAVVSIAYDLIPMRFPSFYAADQPLLERRIRRAIERSQAIIAISECTKRDYVELLGADPTRVHVIYPGVDSRFGPTTDEAGRDRVLVGHGVRRPYLLYVGSLGPHKNVGTLVRVFRYVKRQRHIPHQLVLCGRAAWGQDVIREAHDLIASGECIVLDFVPASDVPYLYHGADGFCFLSLYEGFGLPPAEALACGVPTLVSNAGSLPEVVGNAALMVPPHDEPTAAEALWRLVTDSTLREDLRVRGPLQAARFRWAEAARRTLEVFQLARGIS
jgi:glycosyltransferase involved in cell wall biosynthesis